MNTEEILARERLITKLHGPSHQTKLTDFDQCWCGAVCFIHCRRCGDPTCWEHTTPGSFCEPCEPDIDERYPDIDIWSVIIASSR